MAVPKKRQSRARQGSRRSQWDVIKAPTLGRCPTCQEPVRPHHVCKSCGQYRGRQVLPEVVPEAPAAE